MSKVLGIDLDKLWWGISSGLMEIVDSVGKAFNFLIGADTIDASANQGQGDNIGNLFVTIFNGSEGTANMTRLYLMIMVGCIAFLCIFVAIGAVESQFERIKQEIKHRVNSLQSASDTFLSQLGAAREKLEKERATIISELENK